MTSRAIKARRPRQNPDLLKRFAGALGAAVTGRPADRHRARKTRPAPTAAEPSDARVYPRDRRSLSFVGGVVRRFPLPNKA
jgi:hypothetical protein